MGNRYSSVEEMLNELASPDLAKEFADWRAKIRLARTLFNLRHQAGLSEQEVAERLGWTKKRVENFERREVDKISFGDFERYTVAIGMFAGISFFKKEEPLVSKVKYHVFETKKLLDQLVEKVEGDEKISQEVEKFFDDYFFNIALIYANSVLKLYRAKDTLPETEESRVEQIRQFISLLDEVQDTVPCDEELSIYSSSETDQPVIHA